MEFEYLVTYLTDLGHPRLLPASWLLEIHSGHRFTLKQLGKAGWELVSVKEDRYFLFKRPLP